MRRLALPAVLSAVLAGSAIALAGPPAQARTAPSDRTAPSEQGRLDVLFVGAHPDDESGTLSTLGQWNEFGTGKTGAVRTGVLTVTRGEGGGNAAGTEEGPALGLLREAEERAAVGKAGVTDVHNLDKVDFYYTVSAPLTEDTWGHDDALAKVVRVVRETRPKVIVTMNPAPLPGQHGNHQEAARLATEAYYAAADPKAFPAQLGKEGLKTWSPGRLFQGGGASGPTGQECAAKVAPSTPASVSYGVWAGRASARNGGKTWAQVEREAQRLYVSQGWAGFPDAPSDPSKIGCDYFTQIASRVPFTLGNADPAAMLEGAVTPAKGGLPLGTQLSLTTDSYGVTPGGSFKVTAHASAPEQLKNARATLSVPSGWNVTGNGDLGRLGSREQTATFTVTPPAGASLGRAQISATLTAGRATGQTATMVNVQPPVTGQQEPLPRVADFDSWATKTGVPALIGQMKRVLTVGSGKSREVRVDVANTTSSAQSGTVKLDLPEGFSADAASKPYTLAAGAKDSVAFTVTNTDASLPTSNQGGSGGDYDYTITTTPSSGPADVEKAALELVPVAQIPKAAAAPKIDGKEEAGEYTGTELNLSRVWEGDACESAADCSATGKVTWTDDALNVLVKVRDDKQGTVLGADDCKRHWRTDSVEIGIDPRGGSENTSTTFKTGIFPQMSDGKPCFERDADAHQGGADAAPGMQVAATVNQPYDGYTIEAKIPFKDLPTAVDPARMGLNIFVYDSDTQDKTGQTRIGWSTWGGVQGDPYRWGRTTLPGYTPDPSLPTTPPAPVMPTDAAASVNSPQSIEQAVRTGIPLAGGPAAPRSDSARITGKPRVSGGSTAFRLQATGPGTAHVTVWDGKVLGTKTVEVKHAGSQSVTVTGSSGVLAVAFEAKRGGTASSIARLTR